MSRDTWLTRPWGSYAQPSLLHTVAAHRIPSLGQSRLFVLSPEIGFPETRYQVAVTGP